ncbi:DUF3140 domain-containing protein [Streptomyces sp. NPDC003631]|jgi:hypothetical protein|uniref:DUF3140 domain-containing protein n=1 Tax=Streptomyces lannensis TaxID=766498 RepID=A0ABP7KSY4_9ACTN|nr:DUF3140 domain-containing protein [Streptomyces sp. WAC07094]TFV33575.1 DUF3140 domain-containing protein [Streptomyces sp. T1317-0309]
MADALETDALWDEFQEVVNMTSQELAAWLRVQDADEDTGSPGRADGPSGPRVVAILQKRRMDLTDDDIRVMREVVEKVTLAQDRRRGRRSSR